MVLIGSHEEALSVLVVVDGEQELLDDVAVLAEADQDGKAGVQVSRVFAVDEPETKIKSKLSKKIQRTNRVSMCRLLGANKPPCGQASAFVIQADQTRENKAMEGCLGTSHKGRDTATKLPMS